MRVLVLRHVPHEHLGVLASVFEKNRIPYEYVDIYKEKNPHITLGDAGGLVILGGPMNVYEVDRYPFLDLEDRLVKDAVEKNLPVLGICLGAQIIAKALGARVTRNREKEIGWYPIRITEDAREDRLFRYFGDEEVVFHWHGDTFEIPEGAVHLACSSLCRNQAFRYGSCVYALQFHIEVTQDMVLEWLGVRENKIEIASLGGKVNPDSIREQSPRFMARLNQLAESVFGEFCGILKKGVLGCS
ncbi:GMP synthase [glutamine-hydrolyzing] [bacterium HR37]|nr:GMP synthase [glutamine-hydrolyzing] [bacterium HR37]